MCPFAFAYAHLKAENCSSQSGSSALETRGQLTKRHAWGITAFEMATMTVFVDPSLNSMEDVILRSATSRQARAKHICARECLSRVAQKTHYRWLMRTNDKETTCQSLRDSPDALRAKNRRWGADWRLRVPRFRGFRLKCEYWIPCVTMWTTTQIPFCIKASSEISLRWIPPLIFTSSVVLKRWACHFLPTSMVAS